MTGKWRKNKQTNKKKKKNYLLHYTEKLCTTSLFYTSLSIQRKIFINYLQKFILIKTISFKGRNSSRLLLKEKRGLHYETENSAILWISSDMKSFYRAGIAPIVDILNESTTQVSVNLIDSLSRQLNNGFFFNFSIHPNIR